MSKGNTHTKKGKLLTGDSEISSNHDFNEHSMAVNIDKQDIAQIYVTKVKAQIRGKQQALKKEIDKTEKDLQKQSDLIEGKILSTVKSQFGTQVETIEKKYLEAKKKVKKIISEANGACDELLAKLFDDTTEFDSRINMNLNTPSISYTWDSDLRPYKGSKDPVLLLIVNIKFNGYVEEKEFKCPADIVKLKDKFKLDKEDLDAKKAEYRELQRQIDSSAELQEMAEAAVAEAKLQQSDFGKQCLANLEKLNTGLLLEG